MRLICPNCSAEYEVADNAIPPEGRDVQCGACHTTWFQTGAPEVAVEMPDADPVEEPAAPEVAETPYAAPEETAPPAEDSPVRETAAQDTSAQDTTAQDTEALLREFRAYLNEEDRKASASRAPSAPAAAAAAAPVAAAAAASTEAEPPRSGPPRSRLRFRVDTEPDMDAPDFSDDAPVDSFGAEDLSATMQDTPPSAGGIPPGVVTERRAPHRVQPRSRTPRGIAAMILLCLAVAGVYGFAPAIAQAVPASAPALSTFVASVDEARRVVERFLRDGQEAETNAASAVVEN
ncbi:MAG: zinc-ribbon domain-containing protein [Pseudomonadota bacterium]